MSNTEQSSFNVLTLDTGWVRSLALQCASGERLRRSAIFGYLADNPRVREHLRLENYTSGILQEVTDRMRLQGYGCISGAGLLTVSYPRMTFHISEREGGFTVDSGGVSRRLDLSPKSLCELLDFIDDAVPKIESIAELESRRWNTEQLILSVTLQQRLEAKGLTCHIDITAYHLWVKIWLNEHAAAEYRLECTTKAVDEFLAELSRVTEATRLLETRFGDGFRMLNN